MDSTKLDHALAGALLLELTLSGAVDLAGADEPTKMGRLVIRHPGPTGDDVLDEALSRLERKVGKKPQDAVPSLTKGLRDRLYGRLTERGIVSAERDKVLGLFPRTRWPAADSEHERRVRTQLRDMLVHGVATDARAAALSVVDSVPKVIDPHEAGMDKGALKKRAKAIAEGDWASEAVRKSVAAVNAGVSAAIVAGAVAGTAGS